MPTYLLLKISQWKGQGKQRKEQEQIVLANALMKLTSWRYSNKRHYSDLWRQQTAFMQRLTLLSLWHCSGLAQKNLGNTSTSSCRPDSRLQQSCTDVKAWLELTEALLHSWILFSSLTVTDCSMQQSSKYFIWYSLYVFPQTTRTRGFPDICMQGDKIWLFVFRWCLSLQCKDMDLNRSKVKYYSNCTLPPL